MGVDSAAVMAAGVIDTANLPYLQKEMKIDLKGKDVLGKQELIILDMLQTNDWNRPIYYAITVSPDQFVKLIRTSSRPVWLIRLFRWRHRNCSFDQYGEDV